MLHRVTTFDTTSLTLGGTFIKHDINLPVDTHFKEPREPSLDMEEPIVPRFAAVSFFKESNQFSVEELFWNIFCFVDIFEKIIDEDLESWARITKLGEHFFVLGVDSVHHS